MVLYNKHGESLEEFLGEVHISLAAYKHFKVIDDWYALEDLVSFFIMNVSPCFVYIIHFVLFLCFCFDFTFLPVFVHACLLPGFNIQLNSWR